MIETAVLPVVDITALVQGDRAARAAVAAQLDRACADAGFLTITGAQLDPAIFARVLARAKAYFAQDEATKMASYIGKSVNHSGYVPVGEEQFAGATPDLKEAFDCNRDYRAEEGRRPLLGPNLWPEMPGFREDVLAYYEHVTAIGRQLFAAFALALGLEEDHFAAHTRHSPSQLRLIHYPFDPTAQDRPGIGAHTDYECFTLLYATTAGLQIVDRDGAWRDVPLVPDSLIMNIGDMMEIMSNGRYLATRHRVKRVAQERYAFALFHACDYDHVVAPVVRGEAPRYAPLKSGEHLFNQTAQTFRYLKERIARGELVLDDAVPLDSFGRRVEVAPT
ncbi:isopenicillin N synthase family dioxygenase [Novosphingobium huizhouense]|uniref:isopenicillin N synthase family dioxygenase n=1 Tax=Novosphingobium huizhouense TaxID=2866625 RepID=UPI001CD8DB67|nr:2-oxoglutarate and iron-dependent oxygenase domain-containing protein [Novosphingobium huizhouense]